MKNWLLLLLLLPIFANGQPYGNEWVDFNKEYYKIALAEDGIYKITYNDLNNIGFPVASLDPRRIQLFHRGVEVAIYIEGEGDAVFDPADFIEFYGEKNDGTLDTEMYVNPTDQPHTYYNLYSDTSAYFLTYNLIASNGKRMNTPAPFTDTPDNYYTEELLQLFTNQYSKGFTISSYTNLTQFELGEGFTGTRFTEVSNPVFDINFTGLDLTVPAGPNPELELLLVGRNSTSYTVEVFVGPDAPGLVSLGTYNFANYEILKINNSLNWTAIGAGGSMLVRVEILNDGGTQSNISVSYARLQYARQTDMNSASFRYYNMQVKGSGGGVIEVLNTPSGAQAYDVSDPQNVARIIDTDVNANTITCGFADATQPRKLAIATTSGAFVLSKVTFRKFEPTLYDYIIISNKALMQPVGSINDAVRAYATYRSSPAGGSFDTLVVEINQLYNQFSYGEVTPLSIYRFMAFLVDNGRPKNVLLIGKALDVSIKYHRSDPALFTYPDFVPTAGSPGSDLPFTVNLGSAGIEGAVPVGRLSVTAPQQIINYLNKVVEMEATPYDQLWRKDLLHLSGGNSAAELEQFKSYVDGFKAVAEDIYLGGEVKTVSKATTSTVEFINVSKEVNSGLNLITFFGHSAPNVTDIDIGFVSDPVNGYNNAGKYPMIVMNGCNAGNIYGSSFIFGEDWIATANKGATAVIAHTSYGYPFSLKLWSDIFYNVAYSDSSFMDKSVGEIQLEVGRRVLDFTGPNPNNIFITQIQQMGLQGDPAMKVFGTYTPDYEISLNNVEAISLTDQGVTSEADSIGIALGVRNFGAYIEDSLEVAIRRTLQDGTIIDYDTITYSPVRYLDTLVFVIDNKLSGNSGVNSFEIVLDPANKIPEHDELNNLVFYNLFIPQSGTINLSPANFSILSSTTVDILSQSGDPLAEARGYLFEFDSTYLFTSPFKKVSTITGEQIVSWPGVNLTANDSMAYYWRTKYAEINPNEADKWSNSTFAYINGANEGWGQLAYHQMVHNSLTGLAAKETSRSIEFLQTDLAIEVVVHGANSVDYTYQDTEFIIDGLPFIFPGSFTLCADNKLQIVAFNQENAAPYAPIIGNQVEGWTCGRSPQVINSYPRGKTLDEIIDAIPQGDKVLVFTTGNFDFTTLSATTLAKLEDLGADGAILGAKLPEEPYIMIGEKAIGGGNSSVELTAPGDETITYVGNITGVFASGKMASPDIGPALGWDLLSLKVNAVDVSDVYNVDLIGKDFLGNETILMTNIQGDVSLSSIDAQLYPYLKLVYHVEDLVNRTAAQLDEWLINYELPAEGYITYIDNSEGGGLSLNLQEGATFTTRFAFINVSDKLFTDSLEVNYSFFNQDQRIAEGGSFNIEAPAIGDTTFFTIGAKTRGKVGVNKLDVAVNTLKIAEQIYTNNNIILNNYFTVIKDAANPLLEVSFDGEYIFDGDIVSPNPNIRITIRDDNKYLLKTDTTGIDIFFTRPCEGCSPERISLSDNDISWTPQTESEPFGIDFTPKNLEDGIYRLSVQVEDASGNKSGAEPYEINFQVVNKSTITNFYPYPNPFSTSVKFIFTLTGSDIPDEILIRIITVSGRVVREITQDELGPLRIGNNTTDYAWDGRDEFGDQLANGVYLYKVFIRKNGQQIELRESAGDRGFKNGYGKLYLLR